MDELELVLEALEGGSDGIKPLGLGDGGIVLEPELLHEDEPGPVVAGACLPGLVGAGVEGIVGLAEGLEEMGSGDGVDGIAELVVEVPYPLQHGLHLLQLHRL